MHVPAIVDRYRGLLARKSLSENYGRLLSYNGLVIEAQGPDLKVGELCEIRVGDSGQPVAAEAVGFRDGRLLLMPFGHLRGVAAGAPIRALGRSLRIPVSRAVVGRVIDAFGEPLDGGTRIVAEGYRDVQPMPINPMRRLPERAKWHTASYAP